MRMTRFFFSLGIFFLCTGPLAPSPGSAAVHIADERGPLTFATVPKRVVALNWDLLEQVLELGVTPVGAPNLAGYREWVVRPRLPSSMEDVGTRAEPNLEKISQLKPDVILAASPQKDLLEALGGIAPVVYLPNFREREQAGLVAIEHFKTLAILFAKEELAQQKLDAMQQRFAELRQQLEPFVGSSAKVLAMRFSNITSVFVYSENSTAQYVLDQLGLTAAMPLPPKPWGIVHKRLEDLQYLTEAYVLHVLPFPDEEKLQQSVLWRALPFVRQGRVNSVEPVWNYGGAMSLQYMAEAFAHSLLEMGPDK